MRFRQRSTVLLPHPDGPMNAVTSPFLDRDLGVADRFEWSVIQFLQITIDDVHRWSMPSVFCLNHESGSLNR